uniref:G2/mitotic-specific cyclin-B3 n=1 Tax=Panagrellus redivivus TaxID=6233 RepID=A0A7E4VH31_PANRE
MSANIFGRHYGLRPRKQIVDQAPTSRREKRSKSGDDAAEPCAKRAALDELSEALSNVNLEEKGESPPPLDLDRNEQDVEMEGGDAPPAVKPPKPFVDPLPDYDYDAELGNDHEEVGEYAEEIFQTDREKIANFKVGLYLHVRQTKINTSDRAQTVDWLVRAMVSLELHHEQLYRAVKILDMYIDRVEFPVTRLDLPLFAGVALMMASKYEERYRHVTVNDVMEMTLHGYDRARVMKVEREMFDALDFCIGAPLSYSFLRRFARVIHCDVVTLTLARYILETSLLFYEFVYVKEDILAASSLYLALRMKGKSWNLRLAKYCRYTADQVRPIMLQMNHMMHLRPRAFRSCISIRNKYRHDLYHKVANTPLLLDRIALNVELTFREYAINY